MPDIDERDLRIDVFRAGRETTVVITHVHTGIKCSASDGGSLNPLRYGSAIAAKADAMKQLHARLKER